MRNNTQDKTIYRSYISKWRYLMKDYELVKSKKHPKFRFASDFYKYHNTNRQTFFKYYHRYLSSNKDISSLVPQRRGPKWKHRRSNESVYIEQEVLKHRRYGVNRYEMCYILNPLLKKRGYKPLSASKVYRIFKKNGVNRLKPKMKENKQKIIKQRAGELAHIDCHHLGRDIVVSSSSERGSSKKKSKRYYLVCVIDDCTRIAWAEVVEDIRSLTVMFSTLRLFNVLKRRYEIQFEEVMSDNGSEFSSRNNKLEHPFERMLLELGVRHRYTRPYRPQTNGKIERFWRTMNEDLIDGTTFDTIEKFKSELEEYLIYYNELRPHQGLGNKVPLEVNKMCIKAQDVKTKEMKDNKT